ncbi:hypothetical protein [Micromonospora rifamycinica]|uniref:Uncharacterized protein n=1 Tax=Micromonospora rifamycinica TaxID=291594 RepID=A0A109IJ94_9ACTN|nr:hypothetical protein [Micromonospora rifamycinica]KWV31548.1 hypothetical protein AWV63_16990 [Micromonospora rifamycinica]SCG71335.1 hypothetical protein GA0070623_3586 [Micromonospora rifamycinica]
MTTAKQPAKPKQNAGAWVVWIVLGLVVVVCVGSSIFNRDSGGTTVPAPAADERADTVPLLVQAAESQGICYGWRLERSSGAEVSVGSNLGDGVPVTEDARCPRWVEVRARVMYTAESSESNDWATVTVSGSGDFSRADLYAVDTGLTRFGLHEDVFVDDPGWAICRAAVALPLLVAETGAAPPAATPSADPDAVAAPLPDTGSDFWRDRWGTVLAAAGLLLVAALLITVGFVQRGRQRAAAPAGRTRGTR